MDQLTARNAALPVLTRAAAGARAPAAGLLAVGIHSAMVAAMVFAMLGAHSAARMLAAGLALTALTMLLAPFLRGSWRMREHLLDLGAMAAVLLLPLIIAGIATAHDGGHDGMGAVMSPVAVADGRGIGAMVVAIAVVVAWAIGRWRLARRHRRPAGTLAGDRREPGDTGGRHRMGRITLVVTAIGLVAMIVV